jgi:hypothetical protein
MTPEGSHVYRIISPGSNRTIKHFCRQVHDGILEIVPPGARWSQCSKATLLNIIDLKKS